MICMQRSAHSCEICVELLAGISVLEYAFCTRHNSPLSYSIVPLVIHVKEQASVKGSIAIHESKLPGASREWLWCAVTRCVDFRHVKFHSNPTFKKHMDKNMIVGYFENKVGGYEAQDQKALREINEAK